MALVHRWADCFDPLGNARPAWWRATIWIDVLFFVPFYAVAVYAILKKGKDRIRTPALFWAGMMFAVVSTILFEEFVGSHSSRPSPQSPPRT